MWKMATSCVVYNHKHNFAGKSEFRLLLQDAEGVDFVGIYTTAEYILKYSPVLIKLNET
jgi:hypothetical protein